MFKASGTAAASRRHTPGVSGDIRETRRAVLYHCEVARLPFGGRPYRPFADNRPKERYATIRDQAASRARAHRVGRNPDDLQRDTRRRDAMLHRPGELLLPRRYRRQFLVSMGGGAGLRA